MIKIGARKCTIKEISSEDANTFLNIYHRQKAVFAIYNIGLFYNNCLVAIMTFGYPRYNQRYQWELLRLCFHSDYRIIGGASKLFNYFIETYNPHSILSYCDYNYFSGDVYTKLGFSLLRVSKNSKIWKKDDKFITDNLLRQLGADKLIGTHDGKNTDNKEILLREGWIPEIDKKGQGTYIWTGKGKFGYIYLTTDILHNKQYIGQFRGYKINENYFGSGRIISDLIKKHGISIFKREIIDYADSQEELSEKEIYYIKQYNTLWPNGYNLTLRKQGIDKYRYQPRVHTEETKKIIGKKSKERWQNSEYRVHQRESVKHGWTIEKKVEHKKRMQLITKNPQYIENMSTIIKNKWQDPIYREKVILSHKKIASSEEFKEKCRIRNKKRYENPEERMKVSISVKKQWTNEEYRKKQCIERSNRYKDPKYKEKMTIICKEVWQREGYKEKLSSIQKEIHSDPNYLEKLSKAAKGRKWWNNGIVQKFQIEKPDGEEWLPGRLKKNK